MTAPAGPVGLISNPTSGHNRDHFAAISAQISTTDIHHVVTQSAADIAGALQTLAGKNIDVLGINGGDGTVAAVLGTLLETSPFTTPPRIVLLPAGTANMTAGDVGLTGSLPKAVCRFCEWSKGSLTPKTMERRAMLRVSAPSEAMPHYAMFIGGGAIIHGTEYAHQNIHSKGVRNDISVAMGTVRTVWGVLRDEPPFNRHVTIRVARDDGIEAQYDTLILAISTLHRLAFGMQPFWSDEPGAVRITIMEQGCTRFGRTFFSIVRGKPSRNAVPESGYRSHNTDKLSLQLQGKLNLDGEILEVDGAVEITASQELEFIRL